MIDPVMILIELDLLHLYIHTKRWLSLPPLGAHLLRLLHHKLNRLIESHILKVLVQKLISELEPLRPSQGLDFSESKVVDQPVIVEVKVIIIALKRYVHHSVRELGVIINI